MRKPLIGVLIFLVLIFAFSLKSKEFKIDKSFLIGKLDNKLTFYIKENKFNEDKASLRLLVKVGSALETEEERGIAHFLEHLVFRGSENYKDYEIVKYLESIGAEFGPDTNAFTSYDQTCYMLEIPLKNKADLEKGISFLSDFAFKAKLEGQKIDQERPIVLDELRRSLGPEMRVDKKHLKVILQDTSYEDKDPIGREEVIKNCSYETIRNFYKKWYTPENMALIAVGDFNKDEVKRYVEKYFSIDKKNSAKPNYVVNPNKVMNFSIVNDPEISTPTIELISKKNPVKLNSKKQIKEQLISNIILSILNERFRAISLKPDAEYISAGILENTFLSNLSINQLTVMCWDEKILKGLESALLEISKLKKFGIDKDEFKRVISSRKESIKKQMSNLDKIDNGEYINKCFDNYIFGNKIYKKDFVLDFIDKSLDKITFEEISLKVKDYDFNYLCSVCLTLPQNIAINETDLTKAIENSKNFENIQQAEKTLNVEELALPKFEIEGVIKNINKNNKDNLTIVEFENGLKVFLKPTDLKKNEILVRSYAIGGIGNVKEEIYDSSKIALEYFYNSGIAGIETSNFYKLLSLKNSNLTISLSYNQRNILSDTTKDSFEDIIKLINRIFTSKNYQDNMWDKTIKMQKEQQKFLHLNPESIFSEKSNEIFTSNSYLVKETDLDKVSLKTSQDVIDTFFSNPKDFTFFIVGDFEVDKVISILQKYLGSISDKKEVKIELSNLPSIIFPKDNNTQIVRAGNEDKSFCLIGYDLNSINANELKQWYLLKLMRPIVKERLLQSLRIDSGKTYGVMNYPDFYFYPNLSHFNYFLGFSGPQDSIDSIKNLSLLTMNDLIKKGATLEELETSKKIIKNGIKENLKLNSFIINKIMLSYVFGYENSDEYEKMIDAISLDEMNSFLEKLFSKEKIASVIWLPKEK